MADICDKAGESDGLAVEEALAKIRSNGSLIAVKYKHRGHCQNCEEASIERFCSSDCRDDFEIRQKQKERFKT